MTIQQRLEQKKALPGVAAHISAVKATQSEAIDAEILEMALKYEFVTPLTAMVVTKPEIELANRTSNGTAALNVVGDGEIEDYTPKKSILYSSFAHKPMQSAAYEDLLDYEDFDYLSFDPAHAGKAPIMTSSSGRAPIMATGRDGYDYGYYDLDENAAVSQHRTLFSHFHILTFFTFSLFIWGNDN